MTKVLFDIWFDEKKIREEEDTSNENMVAYSFSGYKSMQDFPAA